MTELLRVSMAAAALTLLVASAAFAGVPWVPHYVTVQIAGPTLDPSLHYELVIGTTAFAFVPDHIGGGARVKTDESQTVTLRAVPGCQLITSFTGRSGYLYDIVLDTPTHAKVSEGFGADSPPLNVESNPSCTLPPTDGFAAGPVTGSPLLHRRGVTGRRADRSIGCNGSPPSALRVAVGLSRARAVSFPSSSHGIRIAALRPTWNELR